MVINILTNILTSILTSILVFYEKDKVDKVDKINFDNYIKYLYNQIYYDHNKIFYVCSYGGCGSYMVCDYLRNFGRVYHIHSRFPPNNLSYIGKENTHKPVYDEWFNDAEIPKTDISK